MSHKHPLDPFRSPEPAAELRAHVLQPMAEAPRGAVKVQFSKRRFTPWDWAWAAALVLVILANALLATTSPKASLQNVAGKPVTTQDSDLAALGILDNTVAGAPTTRPRTMDQARSHLIEGL